MTDEFAEDAHRAAEYAGRTTPAMPIPDRPETHSSGRGPVDFVRETIHESTPAGEAPGEVPQPQRQARPLGSAVPTEARPKLADAALDEATSPEMSGHFGAAHMGIHA
jgi:hypothetical protein